MKFLKFPGDRRAIDALARCGVQRALARGVDVRAQGLGGRFRVERCISRHAGAAQSLQLLTDAPQAAQLVVEHDGLAVIARRPGRHRGIVEIADGHVVLPLAVLRIIAAHYVVDVSCHRSSLLPPLFWS
jgi:hypothetical protein